MRINNMHGVSQLRHQCIHQSNCFPADTLHLPAHFYHLDSMHSFSLILERIRPIVKLCFNVRQYRKQLIILLSVGNQAFCHGKGMNDIGSKCIVFDERESVNERRIYWESLNWDRDMPVKNSGIFNFEQMRDIWPIKGFLQCLQLILNGHLHSLSFICLTSFFQLNCIFSLAIWYINSNSEAYRGTDRLHPYSPFGLFKAFIHTSEQKRRRNSDGDQRVSHHAGFKVIEGDCHVEILS